MSENLIVTWHCHPGRWNYHECLFVKGGVDGTKEVIPQRIDPFPIVLCPQKQSTFVFLCRFHIEKIQGMFLRVMNDHALGKGLRRCDPSHQGVAVYEPEVR